MIGNNVLQCAGCGCVYTSQIARPLPGTTRPSATAGAGYDAELEQQIKIVGELIELKEYGRAWTTCEEIRAKHPRDYRALNKLVPYIESGKLRITGLHLSSRLATHTEWTGLLNKLKDTYPPLAHIIDKGVTNAKLLTDAGITMMRSDDRWDWARFSERAESILCFYHPGIGMAFRLPAGGYFSEYHLSRSATPATINQSTISNIYGIIRDMEREHTGQGRCPHCYQKKLNLLKNKCKECGWQSK